MSRNSILICLVSIASMASSSACTDNCSADATEVVKHTYSLTQAEADELTASMQNGEVPVAQCHRFCMEEQYRWRYDPNKPGASKKYFACRVATTKVECDVLVGLCP